MNKVLIALIALISFFVGMSALSAEGTQFKYFVNANGNAHETKGLSLAYQSEFMFFRTKLDGGMWWDSREGGKPSAFGFAGLGVEPQYGPIYVNFFQSVGLISHTDQYLGGHFQFMEEIGLGFRDLKEGTSVGLFYRHISNAGLTQINKGRDYIGIQVMIPW
jgi:hypothetical protein